MKGYVALSVVGIVAVAFLAGECGRSNDAANYWRAKATEAETQRKIDKARFAEQVIAAEATRDTVRIRIAAVPRLDTLRLTDTAYIRTYITLADSALKSCSALVASCEELQARAALTIRSVETERDAWRNLYEKTHKPRCGKRCGFVVGVVVTVGSAVALNYVQDVIARDHGVARRVRPQGSPENPRTRALPHRAAGKRNP